MSEHISANDVEKSVRKLGFSPLGISVPSLDYSALELEARKIMALDRQPWERRDDSKSVYRMPTYYTNDWEVLSNPLGLSSAFDDALDKFFEHPDTQEKLGRILGDGYRIWEVSIRLSTGNDKGLYFHQDAPGEVGLSIFLTDQNDGGGTTTVVPGSHRWSVGPDEVGFGRLLNFFHRPMRRLLKPITGYRGDSFVFLKKTWHGRRIGNSSPNPCHHNTP